MGVVKLLKNISKKDPLKLSKGKKMSQSPT